MCCCCCCFYYDDGYGSDDDDNDFIPSFCSELFSDGNRACVGRLCPSGGVPRGDSQKHHAAWSACVGVCAGESRHLPRVDQHVLHTGTCYHHHEEISFSLALCQGGERVERGVGRQTQIERKVGGGGGAGKRRGGGGGG